MKKVLVGVAVLGVAMTGANYYYTYQVKKHLSSAASVMRSMGGYLEYGDVSVTLGGDVEVERVRAMAPTHDEIMSLDRIVLHTGGIFGVHQLAMDIRKQRLPQKMALTFEGMMVPTGGETYRQMNALANEVNENLMTAGCGERELFSDADIAAMGFGELVKVDSTTEYRLMNNGQWLELDAKTTVQGMNEVTIKADFSLNATSRDLAALGAAATNLRLNELIVDYKDTGYVSRVVDFCAKETGLSKKEFISHHLTAWQDTWKQLGFSPGNNLAAGYSRFLESPGHFRLSLKPAQDFSLAKLAEIEPEMLPYQFRTNLAVNGTEIGAVEFSSVAKATPATVSAPATTTVSAAYTDPARRRGNQPLRAVAVEELRDHLNSEVVLRLSSGRTIEGRITDLGDASLQVHSYQPTGHMTIPVNFSQISEAYVR